MTGTDTDSKGAVGSSIRVLVVDDHRTFAELLIGAFSREHDLTSVGWAGTVEEGTAAALELRPDVVVLDYHLPDGTGLAAAARIFAGSLWGSYHVAKSWSAPSGQLRRETVLMTIRPASWACASATSAS